MSANPSNIDELARTLVQAKQAHDALKKELADAESTMNDAEAALLTAMQSSQTAQLKSDGVYVTLRTSHRWSIPKENHHVIVELFKANEPTLVKESIHTASLTKFANAMSSSGEAPTWWESARGLLTDKESTTVAVTKSKPKS